MPTIDYRPGIISGANYAHIVGPSSADNSSYTITTNSTDAKWYVSTPATTTVQIDGVSTGTTTGNSITYTPYTNGELYNVPAIYYPTLPTEEQLRLILAPILAAQDKLIKELMDRLEKLEKELAKLTTGRSLIIE